MFIFDESLITGVEDVDLQHKAIFEMVNEFYYAVQHSKGYPAVRGMLEFLEVYVGNHFADEEKLMIEISYEDYSEHRKHHVDFTAQLSVYMEELSNLDDDLLVEITQTIVDWLNCHIQKDDKHFAGIYTLSKKQ